MENPFRRNKSVKNPEVQYSEVDDNVGVVLAAETIANKAFRGWVVQAGIGAQREKKINDGNPDRLSSLPTPRERQLIMRRADSAIALSYNLTNEILGN